MPKIVSITGGTGFIGSLLTELLITNGYKVNILSRSPEIVKDKNKNANYIKFSSETPFEETVKILDGNFSVVNLTGASLAGKRWNGQYKKVLYDSRILTTQTLSDAVKNCTFPPESFISASGVGYYGMDRGNEALTEDSKPGNDFLANLCKDWESEAIKAGSDKTRVVLLRTAFVLDKNNGGLPKMMLPYKLFIGGHIGSGKQWFPWIHISDLLNIITSAIENPNLSGAVNAAAPGTVTNKEFSKTLAKNMGRPCLFPVPGFALKMVIGEFADSLLGGQKVIPEKLTGNKFNFQFKDLNSALKNLLS